MLTFRCLVLFYFLGYTKYRESIAFAQKIDGKCKEYSLIDFYRKKKTSKPLQNTLFHALVSIICGGKPLITTNKLAGPVGKKGVLGGVYRLRNALKTTKKLTEPVTK